MSPKISKAYEAERRQQILRAAEVCFGRKGYHAASVDEIAAEAGLSKGAVYIYFHSKEDLFLALLADWKAQMTQVLIESLEVEAPAGQRLELYSESYFQLLLEESAVTDYMRAATEFFAEAAHNQAVRERLAGLYQEWQAALAQLIGAGISQGEIPATVDPQMTATLLVALLDGLFSQAFLSAAPFDWTRARNSFLLLVKQGLFGHAPSGG
ncbi:MAG TPA: TetR/AcrR family transcriptional regulator [Phototrophicaceae bacterium]|nr:TetR/AcrR family transcriptional regulator [Phototrophicaceae bacterium]